MLVESSEDGAAGAEAAAAPPVAEKPVHAQPAPRPAAPDADADAEEEEETLPPSPMSLQDGIRAVQQALSGPNPPRFPMYVRQAKQFLKNAIEGFDERKYGFASVVDLLRAAGKEGVVRIERDRQGAIRVFPGAGAPARVVLPQPDVEDELLEEAVGETVEVSAQAVDVELPTVEAVEEPPILEAETVESAGESEIIEPGNEAVVVEEAPKKGTRRRKPAARSAGRATKTGRSSPRARKTSRA
jgi:hypothetical protein